jgi:hypothetical protein
MPKNGDNISTNSKMVSVDTVAILLMALGATTVTQKQLETMSALDGTRTAKSFSHQVLEITRKAKEFKARVDAGEEFTPVQARKRGASPSMVSCPILTAPDFRFEKTLVLRTDHSILGAAQMFGSAPTKAPAAKKAKRATKALGKGKVKLEPEGSSPDPFGNDDSFGAGSSPNGYGM